jgi:Tol biopolymer transport system component
MDLDGSNVRRLTYTPGYDGGAYYSWDSSMLVWRANRPQGDDLTDYLNLLHLGLVEPTNMQIYIGNADGSNLTPITNFTEGVVSFAPFFLPDDSGTFVEVTFVCFDRP